LTILADPLHPVVAVHEAPSGPADDGDLQFPDRLDDVETETLVVGQWRPRFEEATVDLLAEVFDETTEDHRIVSRRGHVALNDDGRLVWSWGRIHVRSRDPADGAQGRCAE
jgi:hypothetical protein